MFVTYLLLALLTDWVHLTIKGACLFKPSSDVIGVDVVLWKSDIHTTFGHTNRIRI